MKNIENTILKSKSLEMAIPKRRIGQKDEFEKENLKEDSYEK